MFKRIDKLTCVKTILLQISTSLFVCNLLIWKYNVHENSVLPSHIKAGRQSYQQVQESVNEQHILSLH